MNGESANGVWREREPTDTGVAGDGKICTGTGNRSEINRDRCGIGHYEALW